MTETVGEFVIDALVLVGIGAYAAFVAWCVRIGWDKGSGR